MSGRLAFYRSIKQETRNTSHAPPLLDALQPARGGSSHQPGRFSLRAERLRPLIKEAMASGRYKTEIEPHLTPLEKKIAERLARGKTLVEIEKELGIDSGHASSHLTNLEKKINRWREGRPVRRHAGPHSRADAVKAMVEERMGEGKTLRQVKDSAGLNPTERKVLDLYVMPDARPIICQVAERLGRKKITVCHALYTIGNKLNGLESRYHIKKKYLAMSDAQLRKEIEERGAKSRDELRNWNHELHAVARERRILDEFYPERQSKAVRSIAAEVRRQLKKRPLHDILKPLKPVERDLVIEMVVAKQSGRRFMESHGIEDRDELLKLGGRVLRKLKGRERLCTRDLIVEIVERIGRESLVALRLNSRERELLESRELAGKPKPLSRLGSEWGVSRQAAGAAEKRLLKKLMRFSEMRRAA